MRITDPSPEGNGPVTVIQFALVAPSSVRDTERTDLSGARCVPDINLWGTLDRDASDARRAGNAMADATVDGQRCMSSPPLARSEDPLAYWLNHRHRYTNLFKRAKRFLCIPASTVPCRRIFSKCGEIVSKK
ncbi:hypothetical protein D4764_0190380 [Takifugu flavidus]|uniref:HAT C-terminal dimerisation domain-containing protein n=1 Tax=Takifugu flavidus TaxID=433684 RepID=A0A5C6MM57_9TELE|nr:hypothetical protein D4764_0190380 [Takifugu flavidus]